MSSEVRQLTLVKQGHYYIFRYGPGDETRMIETLIHQAEDSRSPLDWFDAAVLSHQMGQRMAQEMQALFKARLANGENPKAADAA